MNITVHSAQAYVDARQSDRFRQAHDIRQARRALASQSPGPLTTQQASPARIAMPVRGEAT